MAPPLNSAPEAELGLVQLVVIPADGRPEAYVARGEAFLLALKGKGTWAPNSESRTICPSCNVYRTEEHGPDRPLSTQNPTQKHFNDLMFALQYPSSRPLENPESLRADVPCSLPHWKASLPTAPSSTPASASSSLSQASVPTA